ncbi:MAG TPA: hypothetical protein PKC30_14685 [Saprospiraceae bacterium]|nr:hypothetical protein [Saprospiraceae bacterium]
MMANLAKERENKRIGINISIILHLLLLLIAFYYLLPEVPEPKPQPYAVQIEFTYQKSSLGAYAMANQGATRPKTKAVEEVKLQPNKSLETKTEEITMPEKPKPRITETRPTDPVKTDHTQNKSPVEISSKDVAMDVPSQDISFDMELESVPEEVLVTVPEPVVAEKPKSTSAPTSGGGSKDGKAEGPPSDIASNNPGTGKGNTGTGPGRTSGTQNDEGQGNRSSGTGEYDDSGDGVFGRRVIYRNLKGLLSDNKLTTGRTVMKVCINKTGTVTFIEVLQTTEKDRNVIKKMIQAAQGYKYEPDPSAPNEQCGKLTFDFDINALTGNPK